MAEQGKGRVTVDGVPPLPRLADVYVLRPEHEDEPILRGVAARGGTTAEAVEELRVELGASRATALHALGIQARPEARAPRGAPSRCVEVVQPTRCPSCFQPLDGEPGILCGRHRNHGRPAD